MTHIVPSIPKSPSGATRSMESEECVKFNEILDKLTVNRFFEHYSELREYYQILSVKYGFDLNSRTVDPVPGELVTINN